MDRKIDIGFTSVHPLNFDIVILYIIKYNLNMIVHNFKSLSFTCVTKHPIQ